MSRTPVYTIYRYAADWTYAYIDMFNITATHHFYYITFCGIFQRAFYTKFFGTKRFILGILK